MSDLSYRIVGEGPPLLLLHGFGISYNIWQALVPLLHSHFQLILVELPGIGASPPLPAQTLYYVAGADLLDELRRELGITRWSLLCYSTGTRMGEIYVQRYGDTVSRCIFLCPLHIPGWRWRLLQTVLHIDAVLPSFGDWALSGPRLYGLVTSLGFNGRAGRRAAEWTRDIGAQPIHVLRQALRDIPDEGHSLLSLGVPTLYIWGRQDVITICPRHRSKRHFCINANHAAPILAAADVAHLTLEFLR
ncbi:MAG: alpha/beta fold hydrolase [Caldilineaceae bacterium]|nr:alpha/beta fold hydrolase [Caldilineaceae bacterium]